MKDIKNKFLLARDKIMPEMHLRQPDLLIVLLDYLLKPKNEYKKINKQKIQNIFIKTK